MAIAYASRDAVRALKTPAASMFTWVTWLISVSSNPRPAGGLSSLANHPPTNAHGGINFNRLRQHNRTFNTNPNVGPLGGRHQPQKGIYPCAVTAIADTRFRGWYDASLATPYGMARNGGLWVDRSDDSLVQIELIQLDQAQPIYHPAMHPGMLPYMPHMGMFNPWPGLTDARSKHVWSTSGWVLGDYSTIPQVDLDGRSWSPLYRCCAVVITLRATPWRESVPFSCNPYMYENGYNTSTSCSSLY